MITHWWKLIWNRKQEHWLVRIEIGFVFVILVAVAVTTIHFIQLVRQPLGFDSHNVWGVHFDRQIRESSAAEYETFHALIAELQQMEGIAEVAVMYPVPFSGSSSRPELIIHGVSQRVPRSVMTPEGVEVLDLEIVAGKAFTEADFDPVWQPTLINRAFQEKYFPQSNPIGMQLKYAGTPSGLVQGVKIVGMMEHFRKSGEFFEETPFMIMPYYFSPEFGRVPRYFYLLLKVPSANFAQMENGLIQTIQQRTPWKFRVESLDAMQQADQKRFKAIAIMAVIVAAFLILMAIVGLIGVLWLDITKRTAEIGIRRALGATPKNIYTQMLGELWVLTLFSVGIAFGLVVQLPIFGAMPEVDTTTWISGFAIAWGAIFGLVTLCGLYPSWMASQIPPVVALHHE